MSKAIDCWSDIHRNGCGDAADSGIPGVIARLVLFLKRAAEDHVNGSLRVGGGMNDEAVILFQLFNPVLDVCGGVAVGVLVGNASNGRKERCAHLRYQFLLDEVNRVRAYMQALQEEIAGLKVYPRTFARYPFDHIGLALVSKAFSISNALLALLEAGFADEAFGLSRSLMECALTLRFLTQDENKLNQRTLDYARFEIKDKQYWMHYALQHAAGEPMEQKIRDRAKQFDLTEDAKAAQKHWSGKDGFAWKVNLDDHPLDNATSTELVKKSTYAVEYHGTSSYVHCYSPALNNFLPSERTPFEVKESTGEWHNSSQVALFILLSYLHSCVAYALFGMNLERPQRMNDLFSDMLASLLPYRKLRSQMQASRCCSSMLWLVSFER